MPIENTYHGHRIVTDIVDRRFSVFAGETLIGTYDNLGYAIQVAKGKASPNPAESIDEDKGE